MLHPPTHTHTNTRTFIELTKEKNINLKNLIKLRMKNFIRKKLFLSKSCFCFVREEFLDRQGKDFQRLREKSIKREQFQSDDESVSRDEPRFVSKKKNSLLS